MDSFIIKLTYDHRAVRTEEWADLGGGGESAVS